MVQELKKDAKNRLKTTEVSTKLQATSYKYTYYNTYNMLDYTTGKIPRNARYHDNAVTINMNNT